MSRIRLPSFTVTLSLYEKRVLMNSTSFPHSLSSRPQILPTSEWLFCAVAADLSETRRTNIRQQSSTTRVGKPGNRKPNMATPIAVLKRTSAPPVPIVQNIRSRTFAASSRPFYLSGYKYNTRQRSLSKSACENTEFYSW